MKVGPPLLERRILVDLGYLGHGAPL